MKSVLIIGASRGLGLEFVRQYRADGWLTLGTCRSPEQDALLASVGATALRLDVADENSFANLGKALNGASIDVCIYNAGIIGPRNNGAVPCPEDEFDAVMRTNVLGALRAVPVVAPSLIKTKGTLAFISSRMGSIGLQSSEARVVYRASKAALNVVMKTASIEWGAKGVTCISLHPGWVKTDMGGSEADIDPATSITGMRRVIAKCAAQTDSAGGHKMNGHFFNYDGEEIAW
jgi:NAD(P)-dependent dehydrogenase (short-subunit alcohol dehydrogenase family)